MKAVRSRPVTTIGKAPTGVTGFDEITGGGLPQGRTTLLSGGPGSGKTIFAMEFLVHGAQDYKEPGIFVAFEESSKRIVANLEGFGWPLAQLRHKSLFFIDAQPAPELVLSGNFDLGGMLAALSAKTRQMGARRIVFDALDVVLSLLPNVTARKREIYRVHEWLLLNKMTGLITAKFGADDQFSRELGFMQFMMDCSVILNHRVELGVSQRSIRVEKFRGTAFNEDEAAFVIDKTGFNVAMTRSPGRGDVELNFERVSSGVARLDTMLGGGYYRGSSVLITGFPGTAKTTLSGAFAEASCRRGERTLFITFDSDGSEVVRNLKSVDILLDRYVKSGLLKMIAARSITGSAETLLVHMKSLAKEHRARCMIIDPVSTLSRAGNELTARAVAERLIDWAKTGEVTLVCTSLQDESSKHADAGSLQISSLADTWIHLNYLVQAGERNRGLSVIKSRGTFHSNQVRELLLSDKGVTLADIYTAGGEVLMGTLRWQKERAERAAQDLADVTGKLKLANLEAEEAVLTVRVKSLQTELEVKKMEKELLRRATEDRERELAGDRERIRELRGGDAAQPKPR